MDPAQLQQVLTAVLSQASGTNHASLAGSIGSRISEFHYDAENGNTFEQWFKRFGAFIEEDGKDLPEPTKVRLLLGKLGEDEYNKYRDSISPTLPDKVRWGNSIDKLKGLFAETRSLFVRRFECFKIRQQSNQDITSLIAHINASCERTNLSLTKEQLKCMILVIALRDEHHDLRQKCLKMLEEAERNGTNLTLQKLEEELRAIQLVKDSALSLLSPPISTNAIQLRPQQWREPKGRKPPQKLAPRAPNRGQPNQMSGGKPNRGHPAHPCGSCGRSDHWRSDCKFRDAMCHKCKKQGHTAAACHSASASPPNRQNRSFHTVKINSHCLNVGTTQGRWWKIYPKINGTECDMNVDTGAQATIFTMRTWSTLGEPKLSPSDIETHNCNETPFPTEGKFQCSVSCFDKPPKTLTAYVSSAVKFDLFGLPWIEAVELIPKEIMFPRVHPANKASTPINIHATLAPTPRHTITDEPSLSAALQNDFTEVFSPGLGQCSKVKAHLILKPDARPSFCKARPVPHGALEAVNEELDRLVLIGAIKPIEFSHWAAPILAVKKKNGKTRVCIDFSTGLNNALELNRHPLPRPDDIYSALNGAAYFSNLDLKDAYLQMELDEKSKQLCALNTHRGLFQCQRLPFGVKSAPSIFQHLMDQICAGIPGVFSYLDDGLIASKTLEDHISALYQLFTRIKDFGLRINMEKCKFLQKELLFLGHIVSANGIRPGPSALRRDQENAGTTRQIDASLLPWSFELLWKICQTNA
uniref:Reverse transcriptase domain-containing protein n=1 Tax=Globodera pallida TaxID=36090 RepID=A0A183CP16_GLOPA